MEAIAISSIQCGSLMLNVPGLPIVNAVNGNSGSIGGTVSRIIDMWSDSLIDPTELTAYTLIELLPSTKPIMEVVAEFSCDVCPFTIR